MDVPKFKEIGGIPVKKKLLIFLLIIMMTISFVAIVFCFLNKKEEDSKNVKESNVHIETLDYNKLQEMENVDIILEENENEKNIFLVGNFSQNIINNENDALQEIKEVKDILGISNVEEEFEFNKENGIGEFKNYRMQQCYEGIPVDGMQLIISADKDNKVTSKIIIYHE